MGSRPPHRPRRAPLVSCRPESGWWRRQPVPVRSAGMVRQPVGRSLARRQGEPHLAAPAAADGLCRAWARQGPDGKLGRRGGGNGESRFRFRCHRQPGDQRAGGAVGLRRLHRARESGPGRDLERHPVGLRGRHANTPEPSAHRGAARRVSDEGHAPAHVSNHRHGWFPLPPQLQHRLADSRQRRADLAGEQRHVRGCRGWLARRNGAALGFRAPLRRRHG